MHVSWKTIGANCPSEVSWWPTGDGNDVAAAPPSALKNAIGYSFLLSERDMCEEPAAANDFELYLHRAIMTGLEPGARYLYKIGGSGESWAFRAQPQSGPTAGLKFVAFGDLGEASHAAAKSPGAAATLSTIQNGEVPDLDLVLHVGDISYANGNPAIWDTFMDSIEPISARLPYMVQVGNHEYGYSKGEGSDPSGGRPYAPSWGNYGPDSGGECGVMLARRFHMPGSERRDNPPFWYGFNYGSVHFTAISTEHDVSRGSPQRAWLEDELASVDRCRTPWLVLLLHRPMYVVYPHKSNRDVGEHIRDSIEDLLRRYMVDAAISGHVHSYYRTCPVFDERCTYSSDYTAKSGSSRSSSGDGSIKRDSGSDGGHGTVHVIVGSGGHKLSAVEDGQEDWVEVAERTWGYSRFVVESDRRMVSEFVESETGKVLDSFVIAASDERVRNACTAPASR